MYRKPEPIYQEVWDWDIISIYGNIKILHKRHGCMWPEDCSYNSCKTCDCHEILRLSSPVIDKNGRELNENHYGDPYNPYTREAEYLLPSKEGSIIPCLSGKLYKLVGPRVEDPTYKGGSIWTIYNASEPKEKAKSWVDRIIQMISRG